MNSIYFVLRNMKRITKSTRSKRVNNSKASKNEAPENQEDIKPIESTLKLEQFKLQAKSKLSKVSTSNVKVEKIFNTNSNKIEATTTCIKTEKLDTDDNKSETIKENVAVDKIKIENDNLFNTEPITNPMQVKNKNVNKDGVTPETSQTKAKIKREQIKLEYDSVPPIKIKKEEMVDTKDFKLKSDGSFPLHWEEVLNNLREMRKDHDAPVDSMGCDKCMDDKSNAKDQRYQALLSLMLSSQTKDQVTHAAMQRLIEHGCSVNNILITPEEKLEELIRPVGFYRRKVQYIKESSQMLIDKFAGDIPNTLEELCTLKGVGPKMAHLCMKTAWGEVTGIGVDTHVHRISNRMGWVKSKTPEETRKQLEGWLPKEVWTEVNHLLVGFGQQICKPVSPQCATCLNYKFCPFGIKNLKIKNK